MFSITPVVLLLFEIRGCRQREINVCSTYTTLISSSQRRRWNIDHRRPDVMSRRRRRVEFIEYCGTIYTDDKKVGFSNPYLWWPIRMSSSFNVIYCWMIQLRTPASNQASYCIICSCAMHVMMAIVRFITIRCKFRLSFIIMLILLIMTTLLLVGDIVLWTT